jgi:hypothetical protein
MTSQVLSTLERNFSVVSLTPVKQSKKVKTSLNSVIYTSEDFTPMSTTPATPTLPI